LPGLTTRRHSACGIWGSNKREFVIYSETVIAQTQGIIPQCLLSRKETVFLNISILEAQTIIELRRCRVSIGREFAIMCSKWFVHRNSISSRQEAAIIVLSNRTTMIGCKFLIMGDGHLCPVCDS
jgi:hypothetical protein